MSSPETPREYFARTWPGYIVLAAAIIALLIFGDVGGVRTWFVGLFHHEATVITVRSGNPSGEIASINTSGNYTYADAIVPVSGGQVNCSGELFRLQSDTGTTDFLHGSGTIYLSTGNWTGESGYMQPVLVNGTYGQQFAVDSCGWTLTLTAQ